MQKPSQYINDHPEEFRGCTLFYPGAFTDTGPINLFLTDRKNNQVGGETRSAYYCDTAVDQQMYIKNHFARYYGRLDYPQIINLYPQDFRLESWVKLTGTSLQSSSFAFRMELQIDLDVTGILFYMGTEAIRTYKFIFQRMRAPTVLILQDHGYGGCYFGGNSELFKCANRMKKLPNHLFVERHTDPWEGYEQVTQFVPAKGAMYEEFHERAIFKKIPSRRRVGC